MESFDKVVHSSENVSSWNEDRDVTPYDICIAAVENDGAAVQWVPDALQSYKLCYAALKSNGAMLQYISNIYNRKYAGYLYRRAIMTDPSVLSMIPRNHVNGEILMLSRMNKYSSSRDSETEPSCDDAVGNERFDYQTLKSCLEAVRTCGSNIQNVPAQFFEDVALVGSGSSADPSFLDHVPIYFRTAEFCAEAISCEGSNIRATPKHICNARPELYEIAARSDGTTLCYVPVEMRTFELCLAAYQQSNMFVLDHVPSELLTPDFYMAAVQNGKMLHDIPAHMRTREICLASFEKDWRNIAMIPDDVRTDCELDASAVENAILQDSTAISYVPAELRTEQMCINAAYGYPAYMTLVPEHCHTFDLFLAIARSIGIFEKIVDILPEHCRTLDFFERTLDFCYDTLKYMPVNITTDHHRERAVRANWRALQWISRIWNPRSVNTNKLYREAVQNCGLALEYVPQDKRTPELCLAAVISNPEAIAFVPENILCNDIYNIVAARNGYALRNISKEIWNTSSELVETAVNSNGYVLSHAVNMDSLLRYYCDNVLDRGASNDNNDDSQLGRHFLQGIAWCLAAAKNSCGVLRDIPEPLITMEMCTAALEIMQAHRKYSLMTPAELFEIISNGTAPHLKIHNLYDSEYRHAMYAILLAKDGMLLADIDNKYICPELVEIAISSNGLALAYVPAPYRTLDLCERAIAQNVLSYVHVPQELRTIAMRLHVIAKSEKLVKYMSGIEMVEISYLMFATMDATTVSSIPGIFHTAELYIAMVANNGTTLADVPENLYTVELCRTAVFQHCNALKYVPRNILTVEMCMFAIQKNGLLLEFVPETMLTLEMCLLAVQNCGVALAFVPECHRTLELYKCVISHHPIIANRVVRHMPPRYRTLQFYLDTVHKYGQAIVNIPTEMRTVEICIAAVRVWDGALEHVPVNFRTFEMCTEAIHSGETTLSWIPTPLHTEELYRTIVQKNGKMLQYVPKPYANEEMFYLAVQNDGLALQYVPFDQRSYELCLAAVRNCGHALTYINDRYHSLEMSLIAVQQDGTALQAVFNNFRTTEICTAAVRNNGNALNIVPRHLCTSEMCDLAVQNNCSAIKFIPIEIITFSHCLKAYEICCKTGVHIDIPRSIFQKITSAINVEPYLDMYNFEDPDSGVIYLDMTVQRPVNMQHGDHTEQLVLLEKTVSNIAAQLGEHYNSVMSWISRAKNVINYYDVPMLALALQSLEDEKFREVAIPDMIADNECCGDRALMSINKFYLAWRYHNIDKSVDDREKVKILLSGAKTIALRKSIIERLEHADIDESAEVFLYYEIKLSERLNLLTLATEMYNSDLGDVLSDESLCSAVAMKYLKIAAEHPIVDQLIDATTREKIDEIRSFYENNWQNRIEDMSADVTDARYVRMMHHCKAMVEEEILEVKLLWLEAKEKEISL